MRHKAERLVGPMVYVSNHRGWELGAGSSSVHGQHGLKKIN